MLEPIIYSEKEMMLWCFKVALTFFLSSSIGWILVQKLSQLAGKTDKVWKLTVPLIVTPIFIFCILRFTAEYLHSCDCVVADSFAFGVVAGIMMKLSLSKSSTSKSIKVLAFASNGKKIEVILDPPSSTKSNNNTNENNTGSSGNTGTGEILVGDARNKIAEALRIHPTNRVLIETGRGGFIQDLSLPLLSAINPAQISINNGNTNNGNNQSGSGKSSNDFFRLQTVIVYIHIKDAVEEDLTDEKGMSDKGGVRETRTGSISRAVISMLNPRLTQVKYGENYNLLGKIASLNTENNNHSNPNVITKSFFIQLVDKFLAATLSPSSQSTATAHIRLEKWIRSTSDMTPSESNFDMNSNKNDINRNSLTSRNSSINNSNNNINATTNNNNSKHDLNKLNNAVTSISDNNSSHSGNNSKSTRSIATTKLESLTNMLKRAAKEDGRERIQNGDFVVLQCEGKYLSVMRGWWLAWTSPIPRRSGAFIIELVERAAVRSGVRGSVVGTTNMMSNLTSNVGVNFTHMNNQLKDNLNKRMSAATSNWPSRPSISLQTAGAIENIETLEKLGAINTKSPKDRKLLTDYNNNGGGSNNNSFNNSHHANYNANVGNTNANNNNNTANDNSNLRASYAQSSASSSSSLLSNDNNQNNNNNNTRNHNITATATGANAIHDNMAGPLNVGDVFRLRSIKFPDYELGLTSERLRDDYYYLGLRKMSDKQADHWCSPLHFSLSSV